MATATRRRTRRGPRPERRGDVLVTPATRISPREPTKRRGSAAVETPLGLRFFLEVTEEECRFLASRSLSEELIVHAKWMLLLAKERRPGGRRVVP